MEWAAFARLDAVVTDEVETFLKTAASRSQVRRRGLLLRAWTAAWITMVHLLAVLAVAVYLCLGGGRVKKRGRSRLLHR